MFARFAIPPPDASFFLFGPRGTGKSTWVRERFPDAVHVDLLDAGTAGALAARPADLARLAPPDSPACLVLDEIQRAPALLDEVHRLIESRGWRFVLTGSSARKLRRAGVNLLAGRARTRTMHPLTAEELGKAWRLEHSLRFGQLPTAYVAPDPGAYLRSYSWTYLREEVMQEALVRNLGAFGRFLGAASLSQAAALNVNRVAEECGVPRKTVEGHFDLLEDLLLATRIPVFARRAKRRVVSHPKFFFFDAGVFRSLRPRGPLDSAEEIDGAALETLVFQELAAHNGGRELGYEIHWWRTQDGKEVDFVLYGERGLLAFEVKRSGDLRAADLRGVRAFREEYPEAKVWIFYAGDRRIFPEPGLEAWPIAEAIPALGSILSSGGGSRTPAAAPG